MLADSSWILGPSLCLARDTLVLRLFHRPGAASYNAWVWLGNAWAYFFSSMTVRFMAVNWPSISCCLADTYVRRERYWERETNLLLFFLHIPLNTSISFIKWRTNWNRFLKLSLLTWLRFMHKKATFLNYHKGQLTLSICHQRPSPPSHFVTNRHC